MKKEIKGQLLILGDALKIIPKIKEKFDACITDPPYNISGYDGKRQIGWIKSNPYWKKNKNFNKVDEEWDKFLNEDYDLFTEKWIKEICNNLKKNGNILIFGTYHNIHKISSVLEKLNKRIMTYITWYKRNAFPNITQRLLCESTEYIVWAVNNSQKEAKNWTFNYEILKKINKGKQMRNVWDIPLTPSSEKKFGKHPTQKPVEVINRLIVGFTNENDKIIDPFTGSGTIPLVCMKNNRKCFAIDNKKEYIKLAKRRLIE